MQQRPVTMAGPNNTEFTLEQVAEANTTEKLWIIIHGKGTSYRCLVINFVLVH